MKTFILNLGFLGAQFLGFLLALKRDYTQCDKASEQNEIETIENIKTYDWVSHRCERVQTQHIPI